MQDYNTLEKMVHKAILIEQQNKRTCNTLYPFSSASRSTSNQFIREDKGKETATPTRIRRIKCFRCQGYGYYASDCTSKKIMIVLENGEVIPEDEKPGEETDEEDVGYPVKGEMLVTR